MFEVTNRSRNGAPSRKRCVVNSQKTKASIKCVPPPLQYVGQVWEGNVKSVNSGKQHKRKQLQNYQDAQVRRVLQYQEQNWECTHLKQMET